MDMFNFVDHHKAQGKAEATKVWCFDFLTIVFPAQECIFKVELSYLEKPHAATNPLLGSEFVLTFVEHSVL